MPGDARRGSKAGGVPQDLRAAAQASPEVRERAPELLEILAAGHPPAFASDSRDRIVFWNQGAAELLGLRSEEALGRRCHEVMAGRDVFGNRFCYANCPVVSSLRAGEDVAGFELVCGLAPRLAHITILKVPSFRPDLYTLVHILAPVDAEGRLARARRAAGAAPVPPAPPDPPAPGEVPAAPPLTAREREVLGWVASGLQNKEIAQKLSLSLATVRNHIHNVLEKLGVHSKLEAVSLAFRNGWVGGGARPTP
jgi:DNA-binding CsgD family transcriptional regulator